jgi:hypothetical protein
MLSASARPSGANNETSPPAPAGNNNRPNVRMETPKVRNPPSHPRAPRSIRTATDEPK